MVVSGKIQCVAELVEGGTFLLNSQYSADEVWNKLPRITQEEIIRKKLNFYVIDGYAVAQKTGMGGRVNTIMQTCFFAISGVLPKDEAIAAIKRSIKKTYGKKGEDIVKMNFDAVDQTLANLFKVKVPAKVNSTLELPPVVSEKAPDFVKDVLAKIIAGFGNDLPVSAMPIDGTFPTGTAAWEKRNIALEIPVWDDSICIQCGKCALVCPHASIRIKVYDKKELAGAPSAFKSTDYRGKEYEGMKYSIQVAPEDCTGCELCFEVCPVKNKAETRLKALNMSPQPALREQERANWDFFLTLPEADRTTAKVDTIKGSQFLQPLFEFSGACSGCGETPYIKLVTQLFGDRTVVANATGCSSIYGGNLPTTPWTKNSDGRGPAWSNSLFEDNAEFGLGYRLSIDKHKQFAEELLKKISPTVGEELTNAILSAEQSDEAKIFEQRRRIELLKDKLKDEKSSDAQHLLSLADYLGEEKCLDHGRRRLGVRYRLWRVGPCDRLGPQRQYSCARHGSLFQYRRTDVKINPQRCRCKICGGRQTSREERPGINCHDLRKRVCRPHRDGGQRSPHGKGNSRSRSIQRPVAYHRIRPLHRPRHQHETGIWRARKSAVESAHWPLFRYNPDLAKQGQNPFRLDSKAPKIKFEEYAYKEIRYKMLTKSAPEEAKRLMKLAQEDVTSRWHYYEQLAAMKFDGTNGEHGK